MLISATDHNKTLHGISLLRTEEARYDAERRDKYPLLLQSSSLNSAEPTYNTFYVRKISISLHLQMSIILHNHLPWLNNIPSNKQKN